MVGDAPVVPQLQLLAELEQVLRDPGSSAERGRHLIEQLRAQLVDAVEDRRSMDLALSGAELGTWDWDVRSGKVLYSERWAQMLGYRLEELAPHTDSWAELVHPDDLALIMEIRRAHLDGVTESYETEHRVRHKSGRYVWVLDMGRVVRRDAAGEAIRMCGTQLDITEQKELRETIRESEARLQRAHELAKLGNFTRALSKGAVYDLSPEACRIFGLSSDAEVDVEGFIGLVHSDDRSRIRELVAKVSNTAVGHENPPTVEYRIVRPDGTVKHLQAWAEVALDGQGRPTAIFGTVQDQTERKRAEERQLELERRLNEARRLESLGLIAAGIAHDLNNQLAIIQSSADLLTLDLPARSPSRETVDSIMQATARGAHLATQMLAYAGKGRRVLTKIDLKALVSGTLESLAERVPKRCELRSEPASEALVFEGDEGQARQLIESLVANAVEALPKEGGQVTVTTGSMRCGADHVARLQVAMAGQTEPLPVGPCVYLEVKDTGHGMDAETTEKIFEPFFSTRFVGRGLGLAAVHGIVRAHGGVILVQSRPGQGTAFKVILPAHATAQEAEPSEPSEPAARPSTGPVLLVDDEQIVRRVGRRLLGRLGYEVEVAASGAEALRLLSLQPGKYACVILDLALPDLTGEQVLRRFRETDSSTPVLICSGSHESSMRHLLDQGATGLLEKPYRLKSLQAGVRMAMGVRPANV